MTRVFALLVLVGALGWVLFALLFQQTMGQDWMVSDTAAHAYLRGDTALLLDGVRFTQALNETHPSLGQKLLFHPWVYPPYTLLLALPFGLLPWALSYGGFLLLTFLAMAAALQPWAVSARHYWLLLGGIVLCPATAFNIGAGQNSFLSAALLLGGVYLLGARPLAAGLLLGLMAFKPQLALLVPVALLSARAWRATAAAAATVAVLLLISLLVPGVALWRGWFHLLLGGNQPGVSVSQWTELGRLYGQSAYTYLRLAGASHMVANIGQAVAILIGAAAVAAVFSRARAPRLQVTVLLCATVVAAPHFGDYDAVLLAAAAMLLLLPPAGVPTRMIALLATLAWCSTAINPPYLFAQTIPALFPVAELTPLVVLALLWRLVTGGDTATAPPQRAEAPAMAATSGNS